MKVLYSSELPVCFVLLMILEWGSRDLYDVIIFKAPGKPTDSVDFCTTRYSSVAVLLTFMNDLGCNILSYPISIVGSFNSVVCISVVCNFISDPEHDNFRLLYSLEYCCRLSWVLCGFCS